MPKYPGKHEPVSTEPLTATTAGLSSFPQPSPVQCISKGKQPETRGHLLPAIISTDRTLAHREFMLTVENAEEKFADEYITGFQEAFSLNTKGYADRSVDTMGD